MPSLSQGEIAIIVSLLALVAGIAGAAWLIRRTDRATAGIVLIAMTPLVPVLRIPFALGLSADDLLPILGLAVLLVPFGNAPVRMSRVLSGWSRTQAALAVGLGLVIAGGLLSAVLNAGSLGEFPTLAARGAGRFAFLGLIVWSVGRLVEQRPMLAPRAAIAVAVMGTIEAAFGLFAYIVPLPDRLGLEHARKATILFGDVPGRISGTLGISPDFTGAILMVTLILTVGLALGASRQRRPWWTVAALVQFAALALTFSRAPLGLAVVGVIVLIVLANRPILLLPLAATAALVMWLTPLVARFQSDSTDRLALWAAAVRMFADHPLGGVGAGRMLSVMRADPDRYMQTPVGSAVNNAHNTVLLASAELGVLAALGTLVINLVLALLGLMAVRDAATARPRSELDMAAGIAILAVLVQGMVNNLFTVGATGVILALLVGVFLWPGSAAAARRHSRAEAPSAVSQAR